MSASFDSVDQKFESVERRLEMIQGNMHDVDLRLTKLEPRG